MAMVVAVAPIGASAAGGYVWTPIVGGPSSTFCNGITISSTGQYMVCPNELGDLYTSSDYGATWVDQTSMNAGYFEASVSSTGQYMIVSDSNNNLYLSSNYGGTWSSISSPTNSGISSIVMTADASYFALVNSANVVYTSTDKGANWNAVPISGASSLQSLAISADGQHMYAADAFTQGSQIYVSSDHGATWAPKQASSVNSWARVYGSSTGQYVVATNARDGIYLSTDYGATWNFVSIPLVSSVYTAIISTDGQTILAADQDTNGYIYESYDGGQTWARDTTLGLHADGYYSLGASYDASRVTLIDEDGGAYVGYNASLAPQSPAPPTTQLLTATTSVGAPNTGFEAVSALLPSIAIGAGIILTGTAANYATQRKFGK
jgi:photosystem II stability/assembly factor-like uncharacterized protein